MEKFKIVFLDIDGVICTMNSLKQSIADWCGLDVNDEYLLRKYENMRSSLKFFPSFDMEHWPFDRNALKNIHTLSRDPKVRFVISSTWRMGRTVKDLKQLFSMKGMNIFIIDRTPSNNTLSGRGMEIKNWLDSTSNKQNFEVESFVIIDDNVYDIKPVFPHNYVETLFEDGFTTEHLQMAERILNRKISNEVELCM